jgi:hypothetical protein
MSAPVNIVCMKWGPLYGAHYANRLHAMASRHMRRPFRFVCFTDDATGLNAGVEAMPIPALRIDAPYENTPWRKLALYQPALGDLQGPALFMDLDVVVTGPLDPLFDHPGDYCIIHNWTHPDRIVGNSSVFRFEVGSKTELVDTFLSQPTQHWVDLYRNEQAFLSHVLGRERLTYWPADWCVSFKKHCLPRRPLQWVLPSSVPDGARVVVFHGHPNPDEALEGRWPGGWWKGLRPAGWIAEHWRE